MTAPTNLISTLQHFEQHIGIEIQFWLQLENSGHKLDSTVAFDRFAQNTREELEISSIFFIYSFYSRFLSFSFSLTQI